MDVVEELCRKGVKTIYKNNENRTALSYLTTKQKEHLDDFKQRLYCLGKYTFKQKAEYQQKFTSYRYSEIVFSG
jgi:hypothetical protein